VDPQGHSTTGRIKSMKKSSDTIANRTRDRPVCSAAATSFSYYSKFHCQVFVSPTVDPALSRLNLIHSPPSHTLICLLKNILMISISIISSAPKNPTSFRSTPVPNTFYRRSIHLYCITFIIRHSLVTSFLLTYLVFKSRCLLYPMRTAHPVTVPLQSRRPILGSSFRP
jgi:hypothetical protein